MQDDLLDSVESSIEEKPAIDNFFKAYIIFHSITLSLSFLLSLLNSPENFLHNIFFKGLVFAVLGFHIVYFILLIVKKKGVGRIIANLLNFFTIMVIAIGFIFYFGRWPYRQEMLSSSLLSVPALIFVQLIYELAARKDPSKFLNIISFLGISIFSVGLLFFLQKWPYGKVQLIAGGILSFVMTIVHLLFVLKKSPIHLRYLAQCIFAIVSAIMLLLVS